MSKGEKVLNVALPNLSRNYRLNLFEEQRYTNHPIKSNKFKRNIFQLHLMKYINYL